jgi:hypothetical protein
MIAYYLVPRPIADWQVAKLNVPNKTLLTLQNVEVGYQIRHVRIPLLFQQKSLDDVHNLAMECSAHTDALKPLLA